jgi:hypothetical protein
VGNGVTFDAASKVYSVDGKTVATVDSTHTGEGTDLVLNLAAIDASLSAAQQAAAVQKLAQAITYGNVGSTPTDYARAVSIEVSDGSSTTKDASLLTVTPVADTETIGVFNYMTGTNGEDTLTGTNLDEIFVGYGGPVNMAGTASATGDTFTGGGGKDTYVYRAGNVGKDTITDFTLGTTAEADVLNLADLLEGYDAANIADFVRFELLGAGDVTVKVDFNGTVDGSAFTPYLQIDLTNLGLTSTSQADLDALRTTMVTDGQLILA